MVALLEMILPLRILGALINIGNTNSSTMTGSATTPSSERRDAFAADVHARTGIDEDMIRTLVQAFYGHIRKDPVLGPIFSARITDWPPHLERMCAFWSSVALMTGRYHGRPMQAHAPLPVGGVHFDRWLALFEATAETQCPPAAARLFIEKARMIAASLELGIASHRGYILGPGDRLPSPGTGFDQTNHAEPPLS